VQSKVQKWGNSLAVRIPRGIAQESGLTAEAAVDIRVRDGYLVVEPLRQKQYSLEMLLKGVSDSNLHQEADFGPPSGDEVW
jgi:antitoxin MazE